jgi:hypothetical protein
MRRSALRLYAPFIALALVQAAFVVWAPSKGESSDPLAAVSAGGFPSGAPAGAAAQAGTTGSGFTAGAASTGAATSGGATTPTGGGSGGADSAAAGGSAGGNGDATAQGDTSHCKGDRQTDVIYNSPPCAPAFSGDNGGATYPGVTDKEIKFVSFACQPNEQVNAILATQGLAASTDETKAMLDAVTRWMNKTYEFYGREIKWEYVIGDCPTTPPDPAKARQAAAEVAKGHPFAVLAGGGGSAAADVFAQAGILTLGVPWNGNEFYAARRPFRWDIFPSGTESADWLGEYYCKKLAGKSASNAGQLIHPTIGSRTTPRKLGIITPDDGTGTSVPAAKHLAELVKACGKTDTPVFTYQSDINRAQEQTRATVAGLINAKVTTVVCMCDPIAPVFLTNGMTQNNYYPENLLPGLGLLDYDVLGRLYDPAQWSHAFGPSQLAQPVPFEQSDASKIWRAAGNSGSPCNGCNLLTGYMTNLGSMIQMAGPNLNPLSVEQALVGNQYHRGGWNETGGKPDIYLIKYGQNDYNAISDFREVRWSATATSTIDNKQGAYVPINGGRRYAGGELDGSFDIPAAPN